MDEPTPAAPTASAATPADASVRTGTMAVLPITVVPQRGPMGRAPIIFAIISLVVALLAGGVYLIRQLNAPPTLTPEQTVDSFLSAVFLADDATRVAPLVCDSWSGQDALDRTTKQIDPGLHVSWDQIRIVTSSDSEVSATARIGLRRQDDNRPSTFKQWRFGLQKEKTWRICDASPFDG